MANLLGAIGNAQPVSQFINTAMSVQQAGNQNALSQMQQQKEQIALDELKKQQEHLDTTVDFRLTPFYLSLPESARPQADQMFRSMGAFDANYRGTRRQMYQAVGEIEKNAPALKTLMQPIIDAKAQSVAQAFEKMRKNPGDPSLAQAYQQAQMDHATASGKILDRIKFLEAQDAATFHNVPEGGTGVLINKRGEQVGTPIQGTPKARMVPLADPDSPTGFTYGNPATGELTDGAFAPPPRDYNADTLYRSATLEERIRHNRVVESKAAAGMGGKLDYEGARALIRTLPKLKEEAVSAGGNLQRIDEMTALLDKGLGGRLGQAKAWLAPWAEAAGMDVKTLSEAQTYELLAQTLGGSMRMAIVGPGQVSNFEQQMLQKVNAGGRAATPAARELLKYYRDIAARKVNDYNDSVNSVAEVSPATAKLYKRIGIKESTPAGAVAPAGVKAQLPDGRVVTSDGKGGWR